MSFPSDDVLNVQTTVKAPVFFPDMAGDEFLVVKDDATVKSVDIFGDVFIVPESMRHANQSDDGVDAGNADLISP